MQPTRRSYASLLSSAWLSAGWRTPVPEELFPTTRWLGGLEHGRNNSHRLGTNTDQNRRGISVYFSTGTIVYLIKGSDRVVSSFNLNTKGDTK